jgi:hypothetical protein
MTTFFKRFPAGKQNRAQWANFRIVAQWVIFRIERKIRRRGGIKGRLPRVYLTEEEQIGDEACKG